MILPNLANAAMGLKLKSSQKKSTAVGSVPPHSHDSSKDSGAPAPMGNITGSANQNSKIAEIGKKFFQGDEFANQYASKPPVDPAIPVPPQPDPMNDQYGNMFMQPFSKKVEVRQHKQKPSLPKPKGETFKGVNMNGDPKGRPYVVNKEKRGTSRDTLFLPQDAFVSENNYFDDGQIRKATKEAVAKGIYNLPKNNDMFNFSHLEDSGEAKYKKNK